jgi:hypothetical protein
VRPRDRIGISGFEDNHADVHGLEFAKARIQEYYACKIEVENKMNQMTLKRERDLEIIKINEKIDLLRAHRGRIPEDLKESIWELASMIRSGCEIYLKDLSVLKRRTRMTEFVEEISRARKVLESEMVSQTKGGLYDKYYSGEYCDYCFALIPAGAKACNKCVRMSHMSPILGFRISPKKE